MSATRSESAGMISSFTECSDLMAAYVGRTVVITAEQDEFVGLFEKAADDHVIIRYAIHTSQIRGYEDAVISAEQCVPSLKLTLKTVRSISTQLDIAYPFEHLRNSMKLDGEYSKNDPANDDTPLAPWVPDQDTVPDTTEEGGGWSVEDMFETNVKLGVKSTYIEDMSQYTTVHPTGTDEEIQRANQLADEIQRNPKSRMMACIENDDEERDLDKITEAGEFDETRGRQFYARRPSDRGTRGSRKSGPGRIYTGRGSHDGSRGNYDGMKLRQWGNDFNNYYRGSASGDKRYKNSPDRSPYKTHDFSAAPSKPAGEVYQPPHARAAAAAAERRLSESSQATTPASDGPNRRGYTVQAWSRQPTAAELEKIPTPPDATPPAPKSPPAEAVPSDPEVSSVPQPPTPSPPPAPVPAPAPTVDSQDAVIPPVDNSTPKPPDSPKPAGFKFNPNAEAFVPTKPATPALTPQQQQQPQSLMNYGISNVGGIPPSVSAHRPTYRGINPMLPPLQSVPGATVIQQPPYYAPTYMIAQPSMVPQGHLMMPPQYPPIRDNAPTLIQAFPPGQMAAIHPEAQGMPVNTRPRKPHMQNQGGPIFPGMPNMYFPVYPKDQILTYQIQPRPMPPHSVMGPYQGINVPPAYHDTSVPPPSIPPAQLYEFQDQALTSKSSSPGSGPPATVVGVNPASSPPNFVHHIPNNVPKKPIAGYAPMMPAPHIPPPTVIPQGVVRTFTPSMNRPRKGLPRRQGE